MDGTVGAVVVVSVQPGRSHLKKVVVVTAEMMVVYRYYCNDAMFYSERRYYCRHFFRQIEESHFVVNRSRIVYLSGTVSYIYC